MDISEVAKKSGVAASALRYYERKGLIHSMEREVAGFSLDEIRVMFTPGGEPNIDRDMLASKADELDRMVKRLKAMSEGLRHAAACPAPSHAACPSFQRLLKAAASGALEKRRRPVSTASRNRADDQ